MIELIRRVTRSFKGESVKRKTVMTVEVNVRDLDVIKNLVDVLNKWDFNRIPVEYKQQLENCLNKINNEDNTHE